MSESLAQIEDGYARMGSYIGIKMENGNTAWIDPNGRMIEVHEEKGTVDAAKAEVPEEDSRVKNMAHQMFDERMGQIFAEEFDEVNEQ
jgi:hypothetical protein